MWSAPPRLDSVTGGSASHSADALRPPPARPLPPPRFWPPAALSSALLLFGSLHGLASLQLAERLDRERVPDLVAFYDRWADTWLAVLTPAGSVV